MILGMIRIQILRMMKKKTQTMMSLRKNKTKKTKKKEMVAVIIAIAITIALVPLTKTLKILAKMALPRTKMHLSTHSTSNSPTLIQRRSGL